MAETLSITANQEDRTAVYAQLLPQLEALLAGETDEIACMANVTAALKEAFSFFWVGFYRVMGNELVLGPFQGSLACIRIAHGRGVCGTSWKNNASVLVPDVDAFPGHIACSSLSRSELVVPLKDTAGICRGVLDIDSSEVNYFDERDRIGIEAICALVSRAIYQ